MTYEDKTSYDSTPPCTTHVDLRADLCVCLMVCAWKQSEIRKICLLPSLLCTLTIYSTLGQFTKHVDNLPHRLNLELTCENIRGNRMNMGQKFAKSLPATQFTKHVDYRADIREFLPCCQQCGRTQGCGNSQKSALQSLYIVNWVASWLLSISTMLSTVWGPRR